MKVHNLPKQSAQPQVGKTLKLCKNNYLVEVGLRAQNAIWNFRVPRVHKHFPIKFLFLGAFLSQPCDHKHFQKKIFFILLPSFHSPWINVTVINYIDNKRNSIAIRFFFGCVVISISIVGGRGGLVFLLLS